MLETDYGSEFFWKIAPKNAMVAKLIEHEFNKDTWQCVYFWESMEQYNEYGVGVSLTSWDFTNFTNLPPWQESLITRPVELKVGMAAYFKYASELAFGIIVKIKDGAVWFSDTNFPSYGIDFVYPGFPTDHFNSDGTPKEGKE
ncbi:MAG TPA: hypothetical protein VLE21_05205 [Candidatus Nitrosocosmicus sp.]|nr:hypothetical protein [Candidatus Nitrosocosmicus sp.]